MTQGSRIRLAVLLGGDSTEHTISVRSARAVLAAVDRDRYEVLPFGITRAGALMRPAETEAALLAIDDGAPEEIVGAEGRGLLARPQALEALSTVDVVFPLVHGRGGEDGALQGLLELAGLPYVGAGVTGSALGMDKDLTKSLLARTGIPVAPYQLVTLEAWQDDAAGLTRAISALGYPLFAKPANGGSSVGITRAATREDLAGAILEALRFDRKVLVEQGIEGREIECGVLGNTDPQASPLGEITYTREFYDYEAKYEDTTTQLIAPVELPVQQTARIQAMAIAAFQAIDCAGMARVDFFVEAGGDVWLNEINTIPGFTDVSMFPRLWQAAGVSFPKLIDHLVALAFERHEERDRVA